MRAASATATTKGKEKHMTRRRLSGQMRSPAATYGKSKNPALMWNFSPSIFVSVWTSGALACCAMVATGSAHAATKTRSATYTSAWHHPSTNALPSVGVLCASSPASSRVGAGAAAPSSVGPRDRSSRLMSGLSPEWSSVMVVGWDGLRSWCQGRCGETREAFGGLPLGQVRVGNPQPQQRRSRRGETRVAFGGLFSRFG